MHAHAHTNIHACTYPLMHTQAPLSLVPCSQHSAPGAQLATGDYAMPLSLGLELLTTFSRHVYDAPPKVAKKAAAAKPAAREEDVARPAAKRPRHDDEPAADSETEGGMTRRTRKPRHGNDEPATHFEPGAARLVGCRSHDDEYFT